ncbi:MAG: STN domain-containing protein [Bacteroidota bacterium]
MNRPHFLIAVLFVLPIFLSAQQVDINQVVTLKYRNKPLGDVLDDISRSYNVQFSYSPDLIPIAQKVSIRVRKKPLGKALDQLFIETKVIYAVIGDQLVLRTDPSKQTKPSDLGSNVPSKRKKKDEPKEAEPQIVQREKDVPQYGWETPVLEDEETPYIETPVKPKLARRTGGKRTFGQITLASFIGTNYPESSEVTNQLSVNILWGHNGGLNGFEIGGLVNTITNNVNGFQVAGLANRVGGNVYGTQLAGIFNRNDGYTGGFQLAGIYNETGTRSTAVQVSGLLNIANGDITGLQGTVGGNIVYGDATALQIGGLFNYNKGDAKMQMAPVFNIANDVQTGQASLLFNRAKQVEGFQLGIVNICDSIVGAPIGLISLVKNGYNRIELSGGDVFHVGLGIKLGAKPFYNIVQFGLNWTEPLDTRVSSERMSWGLGYGFGTAKPLGKAKKHLWNLELVGFHINEGEGWTKKLNLLGQLRLTFDFYLGKRTSIFFGPSLNTMFSRVQTGDPETPTVGSRIPHWTIVNSVSNFEDPSDSSNILTSYTMWPGFRAGIRF